MEFVKVHCADGGICIVLWAAIRRCALLMDVIEASALDERVHPGIRLPLIRTSEMAKILQWAYQDDSDPHEDTDEIQTWQANFLNMSHRSLLKLWQGATYVKAQRLVRLIGNFIRCIILGKPLGTLKPLKIRVNLTAAQRKQLIDDGVTLENINKLCADKHSSANKDNKSTE